jgi:hypothetical protein
MMFGLSRNQWSSFAAGMSPVALVAAVDQMVALFFSRLATQSANTRSSSGGFEPVDLGSMGNPQEIGISAQDHFPLADVMVLQGGFTRWGSASPNFWSHGETIAIIVHLLIVACAVWGCGRALDAWKAPAAFVAGFATLTLLPALAGSIAFIGILRFDAEMTAIQVASGALPTLVAALIVYGLIRSKGRLSAPESV